MTDKQKRRIEDRLPGQPLEWEGADESINLTEEDVKLLKAADEYAASYEGDDRACIQADVINAFCAGYAFAGKALTESDRAIESEVLAQAGARAEPALEHDGWMVDGSLIYRLSDKGINCDEINITMVNGNRAAEVRHDAAVELLAELTRTAPTIPAQVPAAEEVLSLHRQLAAEKLRADQGWERAEAKSKECIELRERMAAQVPAAEVRAQALRDAAQACEDERVEDTGTEGDIGYNNAINHCDAAIRNLAQSSTADKATEVRAAEEGGAA